MPDDVGHGKSSKPSDGLHQKFPKYTYEDMVRLDLQYIREWSLLLDIKIILATPGLVVKGVGAY